MQYKMQWVWIVCVNSDNERYAKMFEQWQPKATTVVAYEPRPIPPPPPLHTQITHLHSHIPLDTPLFQFSESWQHLWDCFASESVWVSPRGRAGGVHQPWHEDGDSSLWLRLPQHPPPWCSQPAYWRPVWGAALLRELVFLSLFLSFSLSFFLSFFLSFCVCLRRQQESLRSEVRTEGIRNKADMEVKFEKGEHQTVCGFPRLPRLWRKVWRIVPLRLRLFFFSCKARGDSASWDELHLNSVSCTYTMPERHSQPTPKFVYKQ